MRSLREFAQFVGKPGQVISFFGLRSHLFGTTNNQGSSLRAMIQQFEALPAPFDFTLDVKPQSGLAPLLVNTRYGTFVGVRIAGLPGNEGFRVLQNGQVIRIANSETGFAHRFHDGGKFVIEGAAEGIGRDGYARVVRTITVDVKSKPQPEPEPPPPTPKKPDLVWTGAPTYNSDTKKIQISFKNAGNAAAGAFRVNATVNNVSLGEVVYTGMASGQGDTISFSPGFLPSGTYTYNFVLDVYNTVNDESNESNNSYNGYLTIP